MQISFSSEWPVWLVFATALMLLFVFTSLELNTFLNHYMPGSEAGGISILWSIFALGLILPGIWRDVRALRYVGLALFAVVAWKVLFIDMARLEQLYRIIAFIVLGALVLSGSFVYLKYRPLITAAVKNLSQNPSEAPPLTTREPGSGTGSQKKD